MTEAHRAKPAISVSSTRRSLRTRRSRQRSGTGRHIGPRRSPSLSPSSDRGRAVSLNSAPARETSRSASHRGERARSRQVHLPQRLQRLPSRYAAGRTVHGGRSGVQPRVHPARETGASGGVGVGLDEGPGSGRRAREGRLPGDPPEEDPRVHRLPHGLRPRRRAPLRERSVRSRRRDGEGRRGRRLPERRSSTRGRPAPEDPRVGRLGGAGPRYRVGIRSRRFQIVSRPISWSIETHKPSRIICSRCRRTIGRVSQPSCWQVWKGSSRVLRPPGTRRSRVGCRSWTLARCRAFRRPTCSRRWNAGCAGDARVSPGGERGVPCGCRLLRGGAPRPRSAVPRRG